MAGNVQGGKEAAQKILARDPDFYKRIGRKGGLNGSGGGFAVMDRDEHLAASRKGGAVSKRRKAEATKQELPA